MSVADGMAVLENGQLRQIGSPAQLYHQPNSTYVAAMLGSPAMNVLPMALAPAMGVDGAPAMADSLGIRPENLTVSPGEGATITEVEPLGGFTTLGLTVQGHALRALLRGQPEFRAGQQIAVSVAADQAHFFDKTGAAVPARAHG